jgi:hypothetical protein
MALFGKKEEEEIEDEIDKDIEEDELREKKLVKQLKDLKAENRKKRKEPPKPWGKKERITVLVILIFTVLISGALFLLSSNKYQFQINQFQIPNINFTNIDFSSFNIFKEETIMIEKK